MTRTVGTQGNRHGAPSHIDSEKSAILQAQESRASGGDDRANGSRPLGTHLYLDSTERRDPVTENPTDTSAGPVRRKHLREKMTADWRAGMRQVDIAEKYGCSQGYVSQLIGGPPRFRGQAEPTYADLRARNLLAQSLISHRLNTSNPDVQAVLDVLRGDLTLVGGE